MFIGKGFEVKASIVRGAGVLCHKRCSQREPFFYWFVFSEHKRNKKIKGIPKEPWQGLSDTATYSIMSVAIRSKWCADTPAGGTS